MSAEIVFRNKTPDAAKLEAYGFRRTGKGLLFRTPIADGHFILAVTVSDAGEVSAALTDAMTEEPYTLHLVPEANGAFVAGVRAAWQEKLEEIAQTCFQSGSLAHGAQIAADYIEKRYGDLPEFLFGDGETAVWRRKDSRKWYCALLRVSAKKLGLEADEEKQILDLRIPPEKLDALADGKKYFRGYHMNKKHWVTVCLDGSLEREELFAMIDESYALAGTTKKRKGAKHD